MTNTAPRDAPPRAAPPEAAPTPFRLPLPVDAGRAATSTAAGQDVSRRYVTLDGPTSYGEKFRLLLKIFSRERGFSWTLAQISAATGGEITKPYLSMLRSGSLKAPGGAYLERLAKVLGFPPVLWRLEPEDWDVVLACEASQDFAHDPGAKAHEGAAAEGSTSEVSRQRRRLLSAAAALEGHELDLLVSLAEGLAEGSLEAVSVAGVADERRGRKGEVG